MTLEQIKASQVRQNAFSEDLKPDEMIAVDGTGNILARAGKDHIEKNYPNYAKFTAKDFSGKTNIKAEPIDTPVSNAPPPGVPVTPSGLPVSDALADDPTPEPGTRTHPLDDGTPYEGPATVDPTNAALNQIAAQSGTPIKDALKASHETEQDAETAGNHAKVDDLQASQVEALEKDGVDLTPKKAKGTFDHDGDGASGGSARGKDSTAHKGAEAKKAAAAKKAKLGKNV